MSIFHNIRKFLVTALLFAGTVLMAQDVVGQQFGRNKPAYRDFDFKVFQTPHFDIYHYFESDSVIRALAESFERWYIKLQAVFNDPFEERNPIFIYANHPDFQQTTTISGTVDVGVQGLTEALKNRVVIPVLETNAQTDHVIGHELAHVFHFREFINSEDISINSMQHLTLWLVEGMAEYLSIGSVDSHTAMIMRDAIHQNDFPTLRQMSANFRYNPYRFGHSFMAFFGRTWGDDLLAPLYSRAARVGYERALEQIIGLSEPAVSALWRSSLEGYYAPLMADSARHIAPGKKIVSQSNGGEINISPSLSPDGRFITFFSERDLVSIDLFLADAGTGRVIRRLNSAIRNRDIDGFNFFESVGTWSPDGSQFAYVAIKKGQNQLMVVDVNRPSRVREIVVPGVSSFNNPAWSPDGKTIALNGIVGGRTDLFLFNLETNEVTNLTNDRYSYIHSNWSADGRFLAFATDRQQTNQKGSGINFNFNLGFIDMQDPSLTVNVLDIFPNADNVNPIFSPDQKGLFFLSNRDGYRNMYYVDLETNQVSQLTDLFTGISGITQLTPAMNISRETGKIVYSHYQGRRFTIYKASLEDFEKRPVDPMLVDFKPAIKPPFNRATEAIVDNKLANEADISDLPSDAFGEVPFRSRFGLTFIGNSGMGVSASRWGAGMAGGVSMLFSDITGHNQMFVNLAVNGEIFDFGGQVGYLNQSGRFRWGGSISHIPHRFDFLQLIRNAETITIGDVVYPLDNLRLITSRIFEDRISLFAFHPFSTTRRFEVSASMSWYYYRIDAFNTYYFRWGEFAGQNRERLEAPPGFNLQQIGAAYIGDNSFFGIGSPIRGMRYRFGVDQYFGTVRMTSLTLDYRHYHFSRPFTFAFRATHFGRYGERVDQQNIFYPLYLGFPGFVRGADIRALQRLESPNIPVDDITVNNLLGSKTILVGAEIRFPLTGPRRLALIPNNFLFSEFVLFFDAGVVWRNNDRLTLNRSLIRQTFPLDSDPDNVGHYQYPFFSVGPSVRVNLFGALILEPYLAFPFQKGGPTKGVWGLNFIPGW